MGPTCNSHFKKYQRLAKIVVPDNDVHDAYLAHEVGDDPVEGGSLEAESLLAGAKGAEVLGSLRHNVGTQL